MTQRSASTAMTRWQRLPAAVRSVIAAVTTAVGVFAAVWTLLDPLGGLQVIDRHASKTALSYALLLVVSLVLALGTALAAANDRRHQPARYVLGDNRISINIATHLAKARTRVLVLGLSIPSFATEQALRTYDVLLARGVQIDLILVNPLSPSLLQRPPRLYSTQSPLPVTAALSLRALVSYRDQLPAGLRDSFRPKVVNVLPSTGLVVVDDECLWHPYLAGHTGVTSPYVVESASAGYGSHVVRYAQSLGGSAQSATLDVDELTRYLREDGSISFQYNPTALRSIKRALTT